MNGQFPKDYHENMAWRQQILTKCAMNAQFRREVRTLFFQDILFAFNAFFYTLDVRKRPYHHQPFCTWDYEDEFIIELCTHIDNGLDMLTEKSRDMGVSWCVILVFFWYWLHPQGGADFLVGSRIEDYVDRRGDPRSIFEKLRYDLYKLPKFLYPKGFNREKHDNYMRLMNPETGAAITGESNNANFSTGGRYLAALMDEFAKWENTDMAAWMATGDATPCRIAVSTPFGASGQFFKLAAEGKTDKMVLHWSRHPEKNVGAYCYWPKEEALSDLHLIRSPWFDEQCRRRSPTEIAQELQIDYIGAGRPVFDGKASKILIKWFKSPQPKPEYYDLRKNRYIDGLVHDEQDGILLVYNRFSESCTYLIASDVAEGTEAGDYSTIFVLNRRTLNIDAVYHAQTNEVDLAGYIFKTGILYSATRDPIDGPFVAIETNGPGLATFDRLSLSGWVKLFMMPRYDKATQSVSHRKGWRTDAHSRKSMIASVREYIEGEHGDIYYPPTISELMTFVRDKHGKPTAKPGCYDDLVMTLGIVLEVNQLIPDISHPKKASDEEDVDKCALSMGELENLKVDEPVTVEERCYDQVLRKQRERHDLEHALFYYV